MERYINKLFSIVFAMAVILGLSAEVYGKNGMQITSKTIQNYSLIPLEQAYSACGGRNISPDLQWSDAPVGTKSFAIIVHDPDAPMQGGWYHWLVVNIPADVTSVAKGQKITGAKELMNDFEEIGYGGPCPPSGQHRYNFKIYALDTERLNISANASPKEVEAAVIDHSIGQAVLTGLYKR